MPIRCGPRAVAWPHHSASGPAPPRPRRGSALGGSSDRAETTTGASARVTTPIAEPFFGRRRVDRGEQLPSAAAAATVAKGSSSFFTTSQLFLGSRRRPRPKAENAAPACAGVVRVSEVPGLLSRSGASGRRPSPTVLAGRCGAGGRSASFGRKNVQDPIAIRHPPKSTGVSPCSPAHRRGSAAARSRQRGPADPGLAISVATVARRSFANGSPPRLGRPCSAVSPSAPALRQRRSSSAVTPERSAASRRLANGIGDHRQSGPSRRSRRRAPRIAAKPLLERPQDVGVARGADDRDPRRVEPVLGDVAPARTAFAPLQAPQHRPALTHRPRAVPSGHPLPRCGKCCDRLLPPLPHRGEVAGAQAAAGVKSRSARRWRRRSRRRRRRPPSYRGRR